MRIFFLHEKSIFTFKKFLEIDRLRENGGLKAHIWDRRRKNHKEKMTDFEYFLRGDFENSPLSIIRLLRFKIGRNFKYLKANHFIADDKIFTQMAEVIQLLKVLEKDDFGQEIEYRAHDLKFKELQKLDHTSLDPNERRKFYRLWKLSKQDYQKITAKTQKKRKAVLKKVFDLLLIHMWHWYDHEYFGDRSQILRKIEFRPDIKR